MRKTRVQVWYSCTVRDKLRVFPPVFEPAAGHTAVFQVVVEEKTAEEGDAEEDAEADADVPPTSDAVPNLSLWLLLTVLGAGLAALA